MPSHESVLVPTKSPVRSSQADHDAALVPSQFPVRSPRARRDSVPARDQSPASSPRARQALVPDLASTAKTPHPAFKFVGRYELIDDIKDPFPYFFSKAMTGIERYDHYRISILSENKIGMDFPLPPSGKNGERSIRLFDDWVPTKVLSSMAKDPYMGVGVYKESNDTLSFIITPLVRHPWRTVCVPFPSETWTLIHTFDKRNDLIVTPIDNSFTPSYNVKYRCRRVNDREVPV